MKTPEKQTKNGTPTAAPTSEQPTATVPRSPDVCANLEQIAFKAYTSWEEQGRPDGRSLEHWIEAEEHYSNCCNTEGSANINR